MSLRAPISVLIPVRNEAANLAACLASVAFCDEIVVVDSDSTDGTRAIATQAGAKLVDFQWNGRFPKKKNWALANIPWKHEWIFIIDADERVTPGLAAELTALANAPVTLAGYYVNRRFWFIDGWLNHCGYYPSWNMRFSVIGWVAMKHRPTPPTPAPATTRCTSMWCWKAAVAGSRGSWSITRFPGSRSGWRNTIATATGRPGCSSKPSPKARPRGSIQASPANAGCAGWPGGCRFARSCVSFITTSGGRDFSTVTAASFSAGSWRGMNFFAPRKAAELRRQEKQE